MYKYIINDIKTFKPFLTVTLISHGKLLDQLFHHCVTRWAFLFPCNASEEVLFLLMLFWREEIILGQ